MNNIHEITRLIIQRRGEVKAAQIASADAAWKVTTHDSARWLEIVLETLAGIESSHFNGTIWFKSGSYAYLDKDGSGYYWTFIQVPEIPADLC